MTETGGSETESFASTEKQPLLRHANSGRGGGVSCTAAVLLSVLFERTAFYGLAANLVLYLTELPLCWSNANAMSALLVLQGAAYAFGLLGGWLSDSVTGKYGCALLGYAVYIVGYACVFVHGYYVSPTSSLRVGSAAVGERLAARSSCDDPRRASTPVDWCSHLGGGGDCGWSLYASLIAAGLGAALVRTSLGPFGADQVRNDGARATQTFFNWYYWCINVGAFVAYTAIAYVQQFVDFAYGYLIPCCCLSLSAIIFVTGSRSYKMQAPTPGALRNAIVAIKHSIGTSQRTASNDSSSYDYRIINAASADAVGHGRSDRTGHERPAAAAAAAAAGDCVNNGIAGLTRGDVRSLKKLAVVFILLLPYWICYFEMLGDTFLIQGVHMQLGVGNATNSSSDTSGIPAASLTLFNVIFLILALPFVDRWLYPWLRRRSRTGLAPSIHARVTVGMLFSASALAAATVVEHFRQQLISSNQTIVQVIGNTVYDDVAPISIFVQVPQYALLGISEVFACVAGLEYAYLLSPKSVESLVMGCFWFVAGIGSFLGTGIMSAISGGQPARKHYSDSMMAYFYALLSLQLAGALLFYLVGKRLHLDDSNECQSNGNIASVQGEERSQSRRARPG